MGSEQFIWTCVIFKYTWKNPSSETAAALSTPEHQVIAGRRILHRTPPGSIGALSEGLGYKSPLHFHQAGSKPLSNHRCKAEKRGTTFRIQLFTAKNIIQRLHHSIFHLNKQFYSFTCLSVSRLGSLGSPGCPRCSRCVNGDFFLPETAWKMWQNGIERSWLKIV